MDKKCLLLVNSLGELPPVIKFYVGGIPPIVLQLEYLASSLEAKGYVAEILTGTVNEDELLAAVEKFCPIAVGFSVYTFTYKRALSLAKAVKKKAKTLGYEIFIIFGGYHTSCMPREVAAQESIDFAIKGEGETVLCNLIDAINGSQNFEEVKGLFFKKNGKIIETPPEERINDLDSLPLPKRNIKYMQLGKKDRSLGYPPVSLSKNSALLNYSRGCPFACSFCTSKSCWGNQVVFRNPKRVVDEIEMLYKEYDVNNFAFLDLTFNSNRQKTLELCDELIKRDIPSVWGCMVRLDLLDKELLERMAKAKCIKFNLGIESPVDHQAISVKDNYHTKKYAQDEILNEIHNVGILSRAFLIIGFPNETKKDLDKYIEIIKTFPVDELRVTLATPFPETSFWDECVKKGLMPDPIPWEKFTTAEPVIKHPHLTDEDLIYYREKIITSFFFSENYEKHIKDKFKKFPHYRQVWKEYFEYFIQLGVFRQYEKQLKKLLQCINENDIPF